LLDRGVLWEGTYWILLSKAVCRNNKLLQEKRGIPPPYLVWGMLDHED